jgi:hypothetical protein
MKNAKCSMQNEKWKSEQPLNISHLFCTEHYFAFAFP